MGRGAGGADDVAVENVYVKHMTEKALLVKVPKRDPMWIPLSQISVDSEVRDDLENSEGTLVVSAWIAEQKGLLDNKKQMDLPFANTQRHPQKTGTQIDDEDDLPF